MRILYVDLGGVTLYSCDKPAGRILGWADMKHVVSLLVPKLIEETAIKEICDVSSNPERISIITLPFSNKKRTSGPGIILSYFLRVVFSPVILFKKHCQFDIGYSNSPVLVDIVPVLLLKIFGKCRHWVLMMDSIVPAPAQRSGSVFINTITYLESRFVTILAKHFASAVFTVNPELKTAITRLGVDGRKILLSKNGLFMNRINKVLVDPREKKYDASYMGRITENKGIFDLISVWADVVKSNPAMKLAVMGTGRSDVVKKFVDSIKENKLEKNINYLGYVGGDTKYEILKSSKIFIFLSKVNADESWGISLMEALACGLPAITYNLEIYNHVYDDGILQKCTIGEVGAVVDKVLYYLGHASERASLSERCLSFARQFDWFKIAHHDLDEVRPIVAS